ncbi:MAG TPA: PAS domain-containing protein [Polyangia bacterium]|nr:PAS domain-containing protein [Polyangia bacterium]
MFDTASSTPGNGGETRLGALRGRLPGRAVAGREGSRTLNKPLRFDYGLVSHEGRILEANLAGVNLLGVPRAALVKQPITRFIFKEDQDVYYLHGRQLLATGKAHTCELRMVKTDGTVFWVRLTATTQPPSTISGHGGAPLSRVVLSDISEQKQMEQDKSKLDAQLQEAKKPSRIGPKPGMGKNGKNAGKKAAGR